VPAGDAPEAALVESIQVYAVNGLADLVSHLVGKQAIAPYRNELRFGDGEEPSFPVDFRDVKGQEHAKRALEVACAGAHNVCMKGPPGAGKTLLARALPSILPRLTLREALDITRIYSVADALPDGEPLIRTRPFRAPHHTISHAGLVGGGRFPRPGEISLAHRGVLFLDELPEFGTRNLETLRQPLEDRVITISRASGSLTFPANFVAVTAMNPCPCGYFGDDAKPCTCSMSAVHRYQQRISGPLMDRIDIHLEMARVPFQKLASLEAGEPSCAIRARVEAARKVQEQRFPRLGQTGRAGQRRHGAGGGAGVLRHRRGRAQPHARSDAADEPERPRLPSHFEVRPHDCRPGRRTADPGASPGGSVAVSAAHVVIVSVQTDGTAVVRVGAQELGPRRARNMRKTRKKPRFRVFRSFRGYRVPNTCAPVVTYNRLIGHSCISISIMIL
jgi:hypothetical protein